MRSKKNQFRIEGGVVWIKLTQGKETCVDLVDWPGVEDYRWCAARNKRTVYAVTKPGTYGSIFLHRLLVPGAGEVDHINGNGLDNCRTNLRACTSAQNKANQRLRIDNTSGFRGVGWHTRVGKWAANIRVKGVSHHVGFFQTAQDAARAYNVAAKKAFGEFARLNPVDVVRNLSGIHPISENTIMLGCCTVGFKSIT